MVNHNGLYKGLFFLIPTVTLIGWLLILPFFERVSYGFLAYGATLSLSSLKTEVSFQCWSTNRSPTGG